MSDPKIILTDNGARLHFDGGQPVMDDGLENMALISLFTAPGWCGNKFLKVPIGSDFEEACNKPITRNSLNLIRNAAERALNSFGQVTVTVANPVSHRLDIRALIEQTGQELQLSRGGINWQQQGINPAYLKPLTRVPSVPPSELTGITFLYGIGSLTVGWDEPSNLDVLNGGYIIITNLSQGYEPARYAGNSTGAILVPNSYYSFYTEDSGGSRSANGVKVYSTAPGMAGYSHVITVDEAPDFSGVKTNCSVLNGILQLDLVWNMDSFEGNWDDLTGNIDDYPGTAEQSGSYQFIYNLPEVMDCSLSATYSAGTFEVSTSDDGATWSAFAPIAESYTAKMFTFKLTLSSVTPWIPVTVSQLSVSLTPALIEQSGTITIPADITFSTPFNQAPDMFYTIYDTATPESPATTSLSATGLSITSPVGKRVDWYAKGI